MIDMISKILTNVLTALYQPFWFAVLSSILIMFLYLYSKEHEDGIEHGGRLKGLKTVAKIWKENFLHDNTFRRLCILAFYTVMILFRTLLNRNMWANPLSDVMGGWGLYNVNGELTTEPIENLMLFVPFSVLLLWARDSRQGVVVDKGLISTVWLSTKTVFLFSLSIESLQLFLRLGTWQISDLVYTQSAG